MTREQIMAEITQKYEDLINTIYLELVPAGATSDLVGKKEVELMFLKSRLAEAEEEKVIRDPMIPPCPFVNTSYCNDCIFDTCKYHRNFNG